MKDDKTVIEEFNKMVNMTAAELKKWLETSESRNVGWSTDEGSGESVGHDSGRKIVEILESNPTKDSSKYSVEQFQHMKKVVSYCKRHLAQEERIHDSKSAEEVKKTKSYASLKNWGHDPLKDDQSSDQASDTDDKNSGSPHRKQPGTKRDALNTASEGHNKRLKTEKETSNSDQKSLETGSNTSPENPSAHSDSDENSPDSRNEDEGSRGAKAGTSDTSQTKNESGKSPKVGEKVSWNWGRGQPEGKVIDVTDQKKTITTKKGNQVSRKGDAKDPAVTIDTGKSTAIKLAHELND